MVAVVVAVMVDCFILYYLFFCFQQRVRVFYDLEETEIKRPLLPPLPSFHNQQQKAHVSHQTPLLVLLIEELRFLLSFFSLEVSV
jgi:hypothetical protein